MADQQKSFPNIPVGHWYALRTQFKKSIPTTIDSNYIASVLSMGLESARANVIPSLKIVELINTDGKTNQDLARQMRDDESYKDFCKKIVEKVYPQGLRDAFPDAPVDRSRVKQWFMNNSNIGDSAASRIASFYIAMLEGDATNIKQVAPQKDGSSKSREKTNKTAVKQGDNPMQAAQTQPEKPPHLQTSNAHQPTRISPEVNINIQIHISSDASTDQIKSIFENMAKYIYKSE